MSADLIVVDARLYKEWMNMVDDVHLGPPRFARVDGRASWIHVIW